MITLFQKPEARQKMIDIRETFNLWDILKSKCDARQRFQTWQQFAHDPDLKYVLNTEISAVQTNINILEKLMNKFQIQGPDQGVLPSQWAGNSEVLQDEFIGQGILIYMQEHVENLLRSIRTSVSNDEIRKELHKMLVKTIDATDDLVKYLKLRGWVEKCPVYPNTPSDNMEAISCSTASHLWDHVTFRYDNLRKTKIYGVISHDPDLKIIIEAGEKRLEEQVATLEKECEKFGIPLPKRPPEVIVAPTRIECFSDDYMYRDILMGLQGAALIHAEAMKQITDNDRIRKMFKGFMMEEIVFFERFVKYGKTKRWLHPVPAFKVF